jgi:hypothetical protein
MVVAEKSNAVSLDDTPNTRGAGLILRRDEEKWQIPNVMTYTAAEPVPARNPSRWCPVGNESLYVLTRRILRCTPTTQTGQTTPSRVELQKRELVFLSPLPSLLRDPLALDRLLAASSWIRR